MILIFSAHIANLLKVGQHLKETDLFCKMELFMFLSMKEK